MLHPHTAEGMRELPGALFHKGTNLIHHGSILMTSLFNRSVMTYPCVTL